MGSPSLFWEESTPAAGRTRLLQAMACSKEPIPAEVPQPCRAQGLVARPAKKGNTLAP